MFHQIKNQYFFIMIKNKLFFNTEEENKKVGGQGIHSLTILISKENI